MSLRVWTKRFLLRSPHTRFRCIALRCGVKLGTGLSKCQIGHGLYTMGVRSSSFPNHGSPNAPVQDAPQSIQHNIQGLLIIKFSAVLAVLRTTRGVSGRLAIPAPCSLFTDFVWHLSEIEVCQGDSNIGLSLLHFARANA